MQKIPTLFERDWDGNPKYVTRTPNPECSWVFAGEGVPTIKWDGTCVMLDNKGRWWARREVKREKEIPAGYVTISVDPKSGKLMGWEPIGQSSYAKYHAEAIVGGVASEVESHFEPGTYELLGPKINGNPDEFAGHLLIRHGWAPLTLRREATLAPRDYDGLAAWLPGLGHEGIVWHHPDGRMAKIKAKDFPSAEQGSEDPR